MNDSYLYTEGCNFVRHYSNASLTVRMGALVQGLVLLSVWGYIFFTQAPPNAILLLLVSLFGVLFTMFLYYMHKGYLRAVREYTKKVIEIEKNASGATIGPVEGYEEIRRKIYTPFVKFLTVHATFSLIGIAFVFCLAYSSCLLLCSLYLLLCQLFT